MKYSNRHLLSIPAFLLFTLLASAQSELDHIPSDAPLVLTVNPGRLNSKVNLAQFQQYEFFQAMLKEMGTDPQTPSSQKEYLQAMLTDASSMGYNMRESFHFFLAADNDHTFYTLLIKMADRSDFEKGLGQLHAEEWDRKVIRKGSFSIWQAVNYTIAWNESRIVIVWSESKNDWSEGDWTGQENDIPAEPPVEDLQTDETTPDLSPDSEIARAAWAERVIEKKFLLPISTHVAFRSSSYAQADAHIWMDYEFMFQMFNEQRNTLGLYDNDVAMAMDYLQSMSDILYSDTYLSMGLQFDPGNMLVMTKMFVNRDMQRFYKAAMKSRLNRRMIKYLHGNDQLFGYFFMNFNIPNAIEEGKVLLHKLLLSNQEYGQMADDLFKIMGIFIDEEAIGDLWKGDLMLAVSGMKMMKVTEQTFDMDEDFNFIPRDTTVVKKLPVFTMMGSYGNKKDIMKFVNLGLHANVIEQQDHYFKIAIPDTGLDLFLVMHKGLMILTNDQEMTGSMLETGLPRKNRPGKEHKRILKKNTSVLFWDISHTMNALSPEDKTFDPGSMDYMNVMGNEFDNLKIITDKKVKDSINSRLQVQFKDQTTNSMEQLLNFINDLYIDYLGGAKI